MLFLYLYMKEIKNRSDCPVSFSLDFLGDKWTLLILRDIIIHDKSTYNQFLYSAEKIATNILADRLAMLDKHGFLTKEISAEKRSSAVYRVTEKTVDLIPIIMELNLWGAKYNPSGDQGLVDELKTDKEGTIRKYQQKFRPSSH